MTATYDPYPARLDVDYADRLNRLTTLFRVIWAIPIVIVGSVLSATATSTVTTVTQSGEVVSEVTRVGGGIAGGLFGATALLILFRQRYPRWWFDFSRELARFGARIGAYLALMTDIYPSTEDEQAIHLELDYPDAKRDLNRWLPLVKWLLALPHYIVLVFLAVGAWFSIVIAWFAILITGRYPRPLFDFVLGVGRWALRVHAYGFLLITDRYPPFRLR